MRICIVALGKIGLPLAVQCAEGHAVIGADVNGDVVDESTLGRRRSPVRPISRSTCASRRQRRLGRPPTRPPPLPTSTSSWSWYRCWSTTTECLISGRWTPRHRRSAPACGLARSSATRRRCLSGPPASVSLRARRRIRPRLGQDLFVCHSPERVFSGRIFADLRKYPKLIGGIDEASAKRAAEFYESVLHFDDAPDLARGNGVWDLGSAEAAELAKLAETTYRDLNIGFANELAFSPTAPASTSSRSSRRRTANRSATSTARDRRRRPLHPRLSALLPQR